MMLGGGRSVEGNRSRTGKNTPSKYLSPAAAKKRRKPNRPKAPRAKPAKPKSKAKTKSKSAKRK